MLLQDISAPDEAQQTTPPSVKPEAISLEGIQQPLRVVIDIRSNHSDGHHHFNTLINLARERHIDALAFTEHDRYTIRLGIEPVPFLFGYSQEHPSLYRTGVEHFFSDLTRAQKHTPVTLFAGTESTPGYYWQGIPLVNLSLHNAEKHLITLGANHAAQIQALPSYDLRHAMGHPQLSLIFWVIFIAFVLFRLHGKPRTAMALAITFIALMAPWLMQAEVDPYQDFINKAHDENLFVIWTHPGTLSGVRDGPMGVKLQTPPYSEAVFQTPADAFAAVYGDTDSNTKPGNLWDNYLQGYIQGIRAKPIWAVAAGDYHQEGQSGEYLGNFPMDVWANSRAEADILDALKHGRMTAWHMGQQRNIATKALFLQYLDSATHQQKRLAMGEHASAQSPITAVAAIHDLNASQSPLTLQGQWIVDGKVVARVTLSTAAETNIQGTALNLPEGRHVIRFRIPGQQGVRMESNPFFVQVGKSF